MSTQRLQDHMKALGRKSGRVLRPHRQALANDLLSKLVLGSVLGLHGCADSMRDRKRLQRGGGTGKDRPGSIVCPLEWTVEVPPWRPSFVGSF